MKRVFSCSFSNLDTTLRESVSKRRSLETRSAEVTTFVLRRTRRALGSTRLRVKHGNQPKRRSSHALRTTTCSPRSGDTAFRAPFDVRNSHAFTCVVPRTPVVWNRFAEALSTPFGIVQTIARASQRIRPLVDDSTPFRLRPSALSSSTRTASARG